MQIDYNKKIEKYILEYIKYGLELGLFNSTQASLFKTKLINLKVFIDSNLAGDAKVQDNNLYINSSLFNNERKLSLVLFHEFSHTCNSIHKELFNKNYPNKFDIFKNYVENNFSSSVSSYSYGYNTTYLQDINNPYTYYKFGLLLIDEVLCEYTSTLMVARKYNEKLSYKRYCRNYNTQEINYYSSFDYYGIGEELVDLLSKTLFLKNDEKNIFGLCKSMFNQDFVSVLINQHAEFDDALILLYEEISLMGVLAFCEERYYGRYLDRISIDPNLIKYAYDKCKRILIEGKEPREEVPYIARKIV